VGASCATIFTMGARPIACSMPSVFGPLDTPARWPDRGVVAGIAHYGNCVGVPTGAGEVAFVPATAQPLCERHGPGADGNRGDRLLGAAGSAIRCPMWLSTTAEWHGRGQLCLGDSAPLFSTIAPRARWGDPFLEKGLMRPALELQERDVWPPGNMGAAGLTAVVRRWRAKVAWGSSWISIWCPAAEKRK